MAAGHVSPTAIAIAITIVIMTLWCGAVWCGAVWQEGLLLDKVLALRTESQSMRERASAAEADLQAAQARAEQAEVRAKGMEAELRGLREAVAGHEATATTLLHGHASLRHNRSVAASITALCSVRFQTHARTVTHAHTPRCCRP
jgi:hypothetical protein